MQLGTQVGILVEPRTHTLEVYRPGIDRVEDAEILQDGDVLTLPELLPGWEMVVADIWAPVFDED